MTRLPRPGTVLLVGLTFKTDTDDLRESPLVDLAETLIGKGYDLKIYDPDLKHHELVGANLRFVQERLPHLTRLLVGDIAEAGEIALAVIGKNVDGARAEIGDGVPVIDIDRL